MVYIHRIVFNYKEKGYLTLNSNMDRIEHILNEMSQKEKTNTV